jgi:A/G-specific adenine glycosylase
VPAASAQCPIRQPAALRRALAAWYRRHARDLPWRRDPSPYAVLVSEFMLQQTQVATVVPYFARWLARFPDFATLAAAEERDVLALWQGLGYYARARQLHRTAREIVARFGGTCPRTVAELATLPGLGRYAAAAVAAFAFDACVPVVEANIARVLARLLELRTPIDTAAGQRALWAAATALLPARGGRTHTAALMELGALVCTPRAPRCAACPIRAHCAARAPATLPVKKPRPPSRPLEEPCAWIVRRGRCLLEYQAGPRWHGLWKLPPHPAPAGPPLYTATYPFTRYRVRLRVFPAPAPARPGPHRAWFAPAALATLPLAAAHRRALAALWARAEAGPPARAAGPLTGGWP